MSENKRAKIPKSHPRYASLMRREKLETGFENGLVAKAGLIAQGRGEAFDYLIGEETIPAADEAEQAAAAALVLAERPVISINGNAAALCPDEIIALGKRIPATLEINLFYRTDERIEKLEAHLKAHGASNVLGSAPDAHLPGIEHHRGACSTHGIYSADVVLLMLEDGDRTKALTDMGKTVIAVDLNPLSRTPQTATIGIPDNLVRALPALTTWVKRFKEDVDTYGDEARARLRARVETYDNHKNLDAALAHIAGRLATRR